MTQKQQNESEAWNLLCEPVGSKNVIYRETTHERTSTFFVAQNYLWRGSNIEHIQRNMAEANGVPAQFNAMDCLCAFVHKRSDRCYFTHWMSAIFVPRPLPSSTRRPLFLSTRSDLRCFGALVIPPPVPSFSTPLRNNANSMAENSLQTPTDTDVLGDYDLSGVDLDDDLAVAAELAAEGAAGIEEANAAIPDTPTTPVSSSTASAAGNSRNSGGGGKGDILSVGPAASGAGGGGAGVSGGGGTPRSSPSSGEGASAGAMKSNGESRELNGSHSGGRKSSGSRKVRWYWRGGFGGGGIGVRRGYHEGTFYKWHSYFMHT